MRADTAFFASADIMRARMRTCLKDLRSARRPAGNRSSANGRSIAMIFWMVGLAVENVTVPARYRVDG